MASWNLLESVADGMVSLLPGMIVWLAPAGGKRNAFHGDLRCVLVGLHKHSRRSAIALLMEALSIIPPTSRVASVAAGGLLLRRRSGPPSRDGLPRGRAAGVTIQALMEDGPASPCPYFVSTTCCQLSEISVAGRVELFKGAVESNLGIKHGLPLLFNPPERGRVNGKATIAFPPTRACS